VVRGGDENVVIYGVKFGYDLLFWMEGDELLDGEMEFGLNLLKELLFLMLL